MISDDGSRTIKGLAARWPLRLVLCLMLCAAAAAAPAAQPTYPSNTASPAASSAPTQSSAPPAAALRPDQIALLRQTLTQSETQGFPSGAFVSPALDAQLKAHPSDLGRAGQDQLVAAILRYAVAVHVGRLPTSGGPDEWGLRPAAYDPAPDFAAAVAGDRLGPWLDSLPPPYPGYKALRAALGVYRRLAAKGGWPIVPDGPALTLGASGERVAILRQRLAVEDPGVATDGRRLFDADLAAAVVRAQKRYGLEPDGVVHAATLAALNTPAGERVDQIIANMERWRWLPPTLPADRVQVNIAAAVLTLFRDDAPLMSMKAVTGRPGDETPMLQSQIASVVLNPPWNVPSSIATKELWPKERKRPGYLKRNDFRVIQMDDGSVRLQQQAGPKAALGHVKFDFANRYGVYLHDTPTRATFAKYTRQESHGCVRLEHASDLAKALMQGDPMWTPEKIDETIAEGHTTRRAPLPKPISVFLLYWTAFVGANGDVNFRADPYGWDDLLMQQIAAVAPASA